MCNLTSEGFQKTAWERKRSHTEKRVIGREVKWCDRVATSALIRGCRGGNVNHALAASAFVPISFHETTSASSITLISRTEWQAPWQPCESCDMPREAGKKHRGDNGFFISRGRNARDAKFDESKRKTGRCYYPQDVLRHSNVSESECPAVRNK